jgi:uncharacterized protein
MPLTPRSFPRRIGWVLFFSSLSTMLMSAVSSAATPASCPLPDGATPFEFKVGDNTLRGFIEIPPGKARSPIAVIVHGSGSTNITGGLGDYPRLRAVLHEAGIATVLWDRAGNGCSTGGYRAPTDLHGRAEELSVALVSLSQRKDIDPQRIGVWGISQAGWVVPMAAARSSQLAFTILVSTPARDILDQTKYLVRANLQLSGVAAEQTQEAVRTLSRAGALMAADGTYEAYDHAVDPLRKYPLLKQLTITEGTADQYRAAQASRSFLVSADVFLPALRGPVLACFGDRDTLVDWRESARVYEQTLRAAGNQDVTVKVFAGADHNMHRAQTGSIEEMSKRESNEYVDDYLPTLIAWLRTHGFASQ